MTDCTPIRLEFARCQRRRVEAEFSGGEITSDGGVLLLSQLDRQLGLTAALDRVVRDRRCAGRVEHSQLSLLRQRIYGLCLGYEDLNDHQTLRADPVLQTALNRVERLASSATLCRWENRLDRAVAVAWHEVLLEQFIDSFATPPQELVLDFDATDDPLHGQQEGRFFHGYYDDYCFLPLYVFCGAQLLVSYLRPSNIDGAKHSWAILALLVKRLRQVWPGVRIIFRGDSGFCRDAMLRWCERHEVGYIVGIAKNRRLLGLIESELVDAKTSAVFSEAPLRYFKELTYAAGSWQGQRRVVAKIEILTKGANPRFIVTNLKGPGQRLYERVYCARGEMENRIKEQQLGLFADRTSCHEWWANQGRLLLSSTAYVLLERLRAQVLQGTQLARAQVGTIRLKLLKVGAVVVRNTRRVRVLLSSAYPLQPLFAQVVARLVPG